MFRLFFAFSNVLIMKLNAMKYQCIVELLTQSQSLIFEFLINCPLSRAHCLAVHLPFMLLVTLSFSFPTQLWAA
jgi:hypothetical protein